MASSSNDAIQKNHSDRFGNENVPYGRVIPFEERRALMTGIPQDIEKTKRYVEPPKNIDAPLKTALVDDEDQEPYFNSRMNNGECKGKPLSKETLQRVVNLLDKNVKPVEIAKQLDIHHRTVLKYKKAIKEQNIPSVTIHGQGTKTQGLPVPGKQGGFRWSRMNEEQKQTCIRLAVENPTHSIIKIRESLQELYPELQLSDSTVWRVMRSADLQYMRAKMRDPRKEGTEAHKAELEAFHKEQSKGEDGAFQLEDLFFMDETTIYMNERPSQAWGTKKTPPELDKEKGKTQTIAIYAGLGLVSPQAQKQMSANDMNVLKINEYTDTRSNHMTKGEFGVWSGKKQKPDFCLIWWFRPPQYDKTVVSRFIEEEDILDHHFAVYNYNKENERDLNNDKRDNFIFPIECIESSVDDKEEYPKTNCRDDDLINYLKKDFDNYGEREMKIWLHLNNIETRRVDENGELIAKYDKTNNVTYDEISLEEMKRYAEKLQNMIAYVLNQKLDDKLTLKKDEAPVPPDFDIPRAYYHRWKGRNYKGGTKESVRGDRALFIQYLKNVVKIYGDVYGETAKQNLRIAWDSASQHGKVDVTANKKSFIHDWVKDVLNIRGAIFLPVRAPDFNPVEFLFAYIKGEVRRKAISGLGKLTPQNTMDLLDEAFSSVTRKMLEGWLSYGCYQGPNLPLTSACRLQVPFNGKKISNFILETWLNILIEEYNVQNPSDSFKLNRVLLMNGNEEEKNKMRRYITVDGAQKSGYTLPDNYGYTNDKELEMYTFLEDSNGKKVYNVQDKYMDIFLLLDACDSKNEDDNGYRSLLWAMTRPVQKEDHDAETSIRIIKRLDKMISGDSGVLKMLKDLKKQIISQLFLNTKGILELEPGELLSKLFKLEASDDFIDIKMDIKDRKLIYDSLQKYGFKSSLRHKQFEKDFLDSEEASSASIRKNIVDICAIVFEVYRLENERARNIKQKLINLYEQQVRKGINWTEVKTSMRIYEATWKREAVPDKYKKTGTMPTGEKVDATAGVLSGKAEDIAPIVNVDKLRLQYEALRKMEKKKPDTEEGEEKDTEEVARRWPGYPENSGEDKETVIGDYLEDVKPVKKFKITYHGEENIGDKFLDVLKSPPDPLYIKVYYVNGDKFTFKFDGEDKDKLINIGKRKPNRGKQMDKHIEAGNEDGFYEIQGTFNVSRLQKKDNVHFKSGEYYYKFATVNNLRQEFEKLVGPYAEENKMLYTKTIQRFNEQIQKDLKSKIARNSDTRINKIVSEESRRQKLKHWTIEKVDDTNTSTNTIIFCEKQNTKYKFYTPLNESYNSFVNRFQTPNQESVKIRIISGKEDLHKMTKIVRYHKTNENNNRNYADVFKIEYLEEDGKFQISPFRRPPIREEPIIIDRFYPHKIQTFNDEIRLNKTIVPELLRGDILSDVQDFKEKFKIIELPDHPGKKRILVKVKRDIVEVFDKQKFCEWVRKNRPDIKHSENKDNLIYGDDGFAYGVIPENIASLCSKFTTLNPDGYNEGKKSKTMGCAEDQ